MIVIRRTNNPVLSRVERAEYDVTSAATYNGVAIRTGILLLIAFLCAVFCMIGLQKFPAITLPVLIISSFATLFFVIMANVSIKLAKPMSILTAVGEGLTLGLLSLVAEQYVGGAIGLAIFVTFTVFAVTLGLYKTRIVRVGNKFRKFMFTSLISIFVVMLFVSIMQLFFPSVFQISWGLAVGISVGLIIYGALLLIWDFDRVETMVNMGVDKRYEWTLGLGLLIDIVWIYVEVIRLILLLASKSDN